MSQVFVVLPEGVNSHPRQSAWYNTTFLLLAEVVGTGVLAYPAQLVTLGWIPGLVFLFFCFVCNYYTGIFLWRIQHYYPSISTLADASEIFFGPWLSFITQICLSITLFCVMASYLLVLGLTIQSIFYENHICQTIASVLALIFLVVPSQLRTLHGVSFIGVFSTFAIFVVLALCIIKILSANPDDHVKENVAPNLTFLQCFTVISTFVFGSGGQLIYLEMISEMKKPEEFPKAFVVGVIVMLFIYLFVMVTGYHYLGKDVAPILLNVIDDGIVKQIASVFLALHVTVSYTLLQQVLSRQVHSFYARKYLQQASIINHLSTSHEYFWESSFQWLIITSLIAFFAFLLANLIPFFGDLVSIIGSLVLTPISYILPCVYYLQCAKMQKLNVPIYEQIILWSLTIFGVFLTVIGTYSNVENIIDSWSGGTPFSC